MGAGPSQEQPLDEKAPRPSIIDRRDALQQLRAVQQDLESQYVLVDTDAIPRGLPPKYGQTLQPIPRQTNVSVEAVEDWQKQLLEDPKNRLALNALSSNNANDVLLSPSAAISDTQIFNIKIPHEGSPVTNQRSSGRCWLFASTNVFRVAFMNKYKLESFELSQAYLFFWDKLEKANYFLESVLETVDEPLDGRLLQALMASPVGDGGQWDMVANLVSKYGLVPQVLYPDSFNAKNSSKMGSIITTKLREDALLLRKKAKSANPSIRSSVQATKEKMLQEIHLVLTVMLGPPPSPTKPFTWSFYDKDEKYRSVTMTPTAFAKQLSDPATIRACSGTDVTRLISLVNDPRNKYMSLLTVNRLGNVWAGRPITYVNVDVATMKSAIVAMLHRGLPVFFGCDVGKYSDSARGIMDTALFDYELGFNIRLGMGKAKMLQTGESAMTHAMVLTAVQVESGKSVRWRVENSWSDGVGDKGYFVMSDEWMDSFVYQAVVDPSVLTAEVRKVLEQEPLVLPLWDPMGALA